MSDHYHYEYASDRHDHDTDYAGKHHRHHDDGDLISGLREDLGRAEARISELEEQHDSDIRKLRDHIASMPGGA